MKLAPKCTRIKNQEERENTSNQWDVYHDFLDRYFRLDCFKTLPRNPVNFNSRKDFFLCWTPFQENNHLINDFIAAERSLLKINRNFTGSYSFSNRRHSINDPKSLHMGFYEQNLKDSLQRTWKLYEAANKEVLLSLKPILQHLSSNYLQQFPNKPITCPLNYGLFGTIFTTIVVNRDTCHWHLDPKDKLAFLIYFGKFNGGSLALGPPVQFILPIQRFDTILFKSSIVYHKALPFTGTRINISCYSKQTTLETKKGSLTVDESALWALQS